MKEALLVLVTAAVAVGSTSADALRDGRRFDTGRTMTSRAAGAPEQLDRAAFMPGQWDVTYTVTMDDTLYMAHGTAEITYMNRGHAYLERFYCADFNGSGQELSTMAFLMYNPASEQWLMSVANSYTENIAMYNGSFNSEDDLVLANVLRRLGGANLTYYRSTVHRESNDRFVVELASSNDQSDWTPLVVKTYARRAPSPDFMAHADDYGSPAPGLPEEARQFDFLVGEWDMANEMTFPDGREVKFPANGTGVYAMNGHAIMEYSWYDVDTNLPDAATTIVRIYNRHMRRWECMYSANRFNGILYFGGAKEGDKIVLHRFDAHAADIPISYWTFHSIGEDSYGWYADTSRDRGQTFAKTWIISATRRK